MVFIYYDGQKLTTDRNFRKKYTHKHKTYIDEWTTENPNRLWRIDWGGNERRITHHQSAGNRGVYGKINQT